MRDNNKVSQNEWPVLDYDEWRQTGEALHLWSQIAGKYRLAHTPWINHSWHATLYVTLRGLTTGPIPDPAAQIDLEFDFRNHCLVAQANDGARESFALEAMSVADFYERTKRMISAVGGTPTMHGAPNEVSDPIPFAKDTQKRPYNAEAVQRFHQALLRIDQVFEHFRTSFVGKVSPVHLFWGSFDLAVTRFSGRPAPLHPGGIPNLPDEVTQEAYSHEVSSAGFWPGGNGVDEAMFYSYAYSQPNGFKDQPVEPDGARFDGSLGEFLLPYETVRAANDPAAMLLRFLRSTYMAAAETGGWNRDALECEIGQPSVPRAVLPPNRN